MIKLIIGLGNPGAQYSDTRHNAGVWLLEAFQASYQCSQFKTERKFKMQVAELNLNGDAVKLGIPTTYMNESGVPVKSIAQFYKIPPEQILILHDDLDIPVGAIRLKKAGGHGGHNGLRDIQQHLGSADFFRLRVGIGHPGIASLVHRYVLSTPTRDEKISINLEIERTAELLPQLISGHFEKVMTALHTEKH